VEKRRRDEIRDSNPGGRPGPAPRGVLGVGQQPRCGRIDRQLPGQGSWHEGCSAVSRGRGVLGPREGGPMSIHKVIEVLSQSEKSWEDAAQLAVRDAGKTLKNIKSIYVENFEAIVENGQITRYRLNGKITFEVER
jgi:dodecin